MRLLKSDQFKRLITLTVIILSGFHCNFIFVKRTKFTQNWLSIVHSLDIIWAEKLLLDLVGNDLVKNCKNAENSSWDFQIFYNFFVFILINYRSTFKVFNCFSRVFLCEKHLLVYIVILIYNTSYLIRFCGLGETFLNGFFFQK